MKVMKNVMKSVMSVAVLALGMFATSCSDDASLSNVEGMVGTYGLSGDIVSTSGVANQMGVVGTLYMGDATGDVRVSIKNEWFTGVVNPERNSITLSYDGLKGDAGRGNGGAVILNDIDNDLDILKDGIDVGVAVSANGAQEMARRFDRMELFVGDNTLSGTNQGRLDQTTLVFARK